MNKDQFTATGPAFTGAGFPRAAFSTGFFGTDSVYGVNVQGSKCGVYGESVSFPTNRETPESTTMTGVCGIGNDYGVFGKGYTTAGVYGEIGEDGTGVAGVVGIRKVSKDQSRPTDNGSGIIGATEAGEGFGVVGLSVDTLTLIGPATMPYPKRDLIGEFVTGGNGSGTGVLGASGTGVGVLGDSDSGAGVIGRSARDKAPLTPDETGETGVYGKGKTGVKGVGVAGRGGVFESDQLAQVNLTPLFNQPNLPCEGEVGDVLVESPLIKQDQLDNSRNLDGVGTLWFCIRSQTPERGPAVWAQVAFTGVATCSLGRVPRPPQHLPPLKE